MQSRVMTISEVARNCGVSLRTLRFYEQRGLLNPVRIGPQRLYTAKDQIRLDLILKGKRLGFTLRDIERLLAESRVIEPLGQREHIGLPLDIKQIGQQLQALEQRRNMVIEAISELRQALGAKN